MAAEPYCPPDWTCSFTPPAASELPWWQGDGGAVLAWIALVFAAILIAMVIFKAFEHMSTRKSAKTAAKERELERRHRLAVEEQHTLQVDACRGNPEMLDLVREMQR